MSSYLVIARKWRPNLFEEMVGQPHVTRTLKNALSSGRIAHAYLFSGPRGVGKTTAARILAKSLNCINGPTPSPCNACESCKAIAGGSSVDVFEIDGASNNSVDNIRELREGIRYVPSQGKFKVYIIDEVHMLSGAAFNALLKTLEEPPAHAVFVFATTEAHKIPATILSRCQRFDFKRIALKEIQQHLKKIVTQEGISFEDKALFTISREADGSLRDAQSLLDQVIAFSDGGVADSDVNEALGLMDRSILYELSGAIISKDSPACLNIVEKVYNFGYDLKKACSDLLEHIRDLTVLKSTGDDKLLDLPDSELERLKTLAQSIGVERLHMLWSVISRGYEEVTRSAVPRYSMEMAVLKAAHLEEIQPVSELISRLEGLKQKLEGARQPHGRGGPDMPAPSSGVKYAAPQAKPPLKALEPAPKPVLKEKEDGEGVNGVKDVRGAEIGKEGVAAGYVSGLIEYITGKNRPLAEPLQNAAINIEGNGIDITVSKPGMLLIKKDLLENICSEFLGRRMKVNINAAIPDKNDEKNKERGADPLVKDALRILGGKVVEERRRTNV